MHPLDPSVLLGWGRPFRSVEVTNRHLHPELETPRRRRLTPSSASATSPIRMPGRDDAPDARREPNARASRSSSSATNDRSVSALRRAGFHKTCRTALCDTDPPLVLTHLPLLKVPAGAVQRPRPAAPGHRADRPARQGVGGAHATTPSMGLTYVLELARRRSGTERRRPAAAVAVGEVTREGLPDQIRAADCADLGACRSRSGRLETLRTVEQRPLSTSGQCTSQPSLDVALRVPVAEPAKDRAESDCSLRPRAIRT